MAGQNGEVVTDEGRNGTGRAPRAEAACWTGGLSEGVKTSRRIACYCSRR